MIAASTKKLVDPVEAFRQRAEARAHLWSIGDIDLHDAVDQLQHDAERDLLIEQVGQDAVQASKAAAQRQSTRAERPTPQSTIEAVMVAVRARGIGALREPDNLQRLRRCDAKAKAEINRRIDALFQKGILK
jgi:hypothetical protein